MAWVVFLRAINVGATNRCRPALIAQELKRLKVVNVGAVGTFIVGQETSEAEVRAAFTRKLPFSCEIMIVPASDVLRLAAQDPFAGQPSAPEITRFVNILHRPLRVPPALPLCLPSVADWRARLIAVHGRFVLGLYYREMKAISYLGKLEKLLGEPATTRNWNIIAKLTMLLSET